MIQNVLLVTFIAFIVLLQLLAVRSVFIVRQLTYSQHHARQHEKYPEGWKPFMRPRPHTLPHIVPMIIRAITVAPFKLLGIISAVLFTSASAFVVSPRRSLLVAHICGNLVAWLAGVSKIVWVGKPALPNEAPLVVANHISWIDFIVLGATRMFGFVMSEEVSKTPLVGPGFTKLALHVESIILDRSDAKSRDAAKLRIKSKLEKMQSSGHCERLLVFSEGTLTNGEYVVPFKLGAFESLVPTQPLRLEFSNPHFSLACLGTLEGSLFFLCLGSTKLTLTWGEVVTPTPKDTPESLSQRVRESLVKGSTMLPAPSGNYRDHLALYSTRFNVQ